MQTARAMFEKAMQAGEKRDYAKAVELLTGIISETDEMPEAYLYLGRALHAQKRYDKAVSAFRTFLAYAEEGSPEEAITWFFLGRSYLSRNRPAQAARCLSTANKRKPDDPRILAMLGAAWLKSRRSKRAVACLERAVTIAPGDARIMRAYVNALFVQGIRTLERGDSDLACQILTFVIANGGNASLVRLHRARAYRSLGKFKEALADYDAVLAEFPHDNSLRFQRAAVLLAMGDPRSAYEEIEELKRSGADIPEMQWDTEALASFHAYSLLTQGNYRAAAREAVDALRANPQDMRMRFVAAEAYRSLGSYEKAANHYRRVMESDPKSFEPCLGLAASLHAMRDFRGAIKAAQAARNRGAEPADTDYFAVLCSIELPNPDYSKLLPMAQELIRSHGAEPNLMFALAKIYFSVGRADLSVGWFKKTVELVPNHEMALLYLITIGETGGNDDEIAKAYETYLEKYPDNTSIRRDFIHILISDKRFEEAARFIEEGFTWDSPGAGTRRMLAICLRNAGKWRDAAILYRELLREDVTNMEFLLGLAYSLDRSGVPERAVALLERAKEHLGEHADIYLLLGTVLARSKKHEAALIAFRKAAELDKRNDRPWRNMATLYESRKQFDLARMCMQNAESALKSRAAKPSRRG